MKSLLLALTFVFSATAFASTPASVLVNNLIPNGEYRGMNGTKECAVKIVATENAVSIFIANKNDSQGFTIVNSANNYSINNATGKISATQRLNAPHYVQGAAQVLTINNKNTEISFSIALIAMNHRGADMSTYTTCSIKK